MEVMGASSGWPEASRTGWFWAFGHAAVVARGMGIPCVAGAGAIEVNEQRQEMSVAVDGKKMTLKEGDWLSLDGSTGQVFAGQANTIDADPSSGVMASFMEWADVFRGSFGVRAN